MAEWSAARCCEGSPREDVKLLTVKRRELDLRDQAAVNRWFAEKRPQAVFLAAAKVGGIVANNTLRGEFLYDNLVDRDQRHSCGACQRRRETDVSRLVLHLSQTREPSRCAKMPC